jgi:hypothetical protein
MSQEFCINTVISKTVAAYVALPNYDVLKEDILQHTYGRFKWKLLDDPTCTNEDPKYSNIQRVLFVNEQSVIVQEVEKTYDSTRFNTYKIMLEDWSRVFIAWAERRTADWNDCWDQGFRMYGADV